jgi:hypothetical protein
MCTCNIFILLIVSLRFTINVTNLTIPSFVSWFRIFSQYGVGIVFFLGFGKVMQYPSTFHGECKYPKMMHVLHLNSITLFKCGEFFNTFIYLNQYVWYDIVNME